MQPVGGTGTYAVYNAGGESANGHVFENSVTQPISVANLQVSKNYGYKTTMAARQLLPMGLPRSR